MRNEAIRYDSCIYLICVKLNPYANKEHIYSEHLSLVKVTFAF